MEKKIEKMFFAPYVIASELVALRFPYLEENSCH